MNRKILFTARDAGAAQQLMPVIDYFSAQGSTIFIYASDPAYSILKYNGYPVCLYEIEGNIAIDENSPLVEPAINIVKNILDERKPDAVICGLSSGLYGIDEFIIFLIKSRTLHIPCFQLLDYWHSLHHYKDTCPDTYFVIDKETILVDYKNIQAPMQEVGSPKHFAYTLKKVDAIKKNIREYYQIKETETLIGFFGQNPILEGQFDNFKILVDCIERLHQMGKDVVFIYKPHPGYLNSYDTFNNYLNTKSFKRYNLGENKNIIDILCLCDIITTCYSTVAIDHAYLSYAASKAIGAVIHLRYGDGIKRLIKETFIFDKSSLIKDVKSFDANTEDELFEMLLSDVEHQKLQKEYYQSVKNMKTISNSAKKIYSMVELVLS